ncbi:MAG: dynamin family protein [Bacteroidaceae bacterium]|nr:dynamin family protein [Bacteroidaceae bacterium]
MEKNIDNISAQIKQNLIELCNKTLTCANTEEFPNGTKDIEYALNNIKNDIFDVVVCGEVKKGKSSFINAIMGENILPVDTRVATSQAFRIVNSEEQAFYLVFTDGSKQRVGREELENYGSQVKIDKNGEPITFGKIVDYMEVHTPIPFLPKSVVLVDTPGLGAIYANHAIVTMRHLAKASAVIFVMDPANPLTDTELSFLNTITETTSNVLLVMTKQDNYDSEYIEAQIKRNMEILVEKGFKDKFSCDEVKILPMSSTLLYDVSNAEMENTDRETFYEISCFETVKMELLRMLQTTIGLSKSIVAYNALNDYNSQVMSAISERDTVLNSLGDGKQLLVEKQQVKANFQSKWGPNGEQQKMIIKEVNDTISVYSSKATAMFNPGSELYNKMFLEIDGLTTYDEAKVFANMFPKRMMTEYMQAWKGLNEDCINKISKIMSKYRKKMQDDRNRELSNTFLGNVILPPYTMPKYGMMDFFNDTKGGWFTLFFVANVFSLPLSLVALPIAALIGWFTGNKTKLNRMKVELKGYLNTNLSTLRSQVLYSPVNENDSLSKSLYETTKEKLLQTAQTTLREIYNEQLSLSDDEVKRLNNQITNINQKRHELTQNLQTIRNKWDPIYTQLKELREELKSLELLIKSSCFTKE